VLGGGFDAVFRVLDAAKGSTLEGDEFDTTEMNPPEPDSRIRRITRFDGEFPRLT
jgi:hypothetical protein